MKCRDANLKINHDYEGSSNSMYEYFLGSSGISVGHFRPPES